MNFDRIKRKVAGLRAVFEQFDKNKDGVLERGEFRRGIFLLKAGLSAAHISEIMQARDEMMTASLTRVICFCCRFHTPASLTCASPAADGQ